MATYPAHVVTFATHHDGEVVSSADPNTIQGEVFAIETILGVNPHVSTTPNPASTFTATTTAFANLGTRLANIETGIVSDAHGQYAYRSGGTLTNPTINGATMDAASTHGGVTGTSLAADRTAWGGFTPVWTADVVNPVLGNGAFSCRYKQIGKTVKYHFKVLFGSTTNFGTGNWTFTLPAAANAGMAILGGVFITKATNSVGIFEGQVIPSGGGSTMQLWNPSASAIWDGAQPGGVWANGDSIKGILVYEST